MARKRIRDERLKNQIIDLAETIVADEGHHSATARRLAGESGISVGTLYNIFGHLDSLVRAVNLRSMADLHRALSDARDSKPPEPELRIVAMAEAYLDYAVANRNRWEALFRYRSTTPGDGTVMAAEARLFDLLKAAAEDGTPEDALRALWAAVHGVCELTLSQSARNVEIDGRGFARLIVMAGLRGFAMLQSEGRYPP